MSHPQSGAMTTESLRGNLSGELPLEGWKTLVMHCQLDEIGPSDEHPDLVRIKVAIPPSEPSVRMVEASAVWHRDLLVDLPGFEPIAEEEPATPPQVQALLEVAHPILAAPPANPGAARLHSTTGARCRTFGA
ncbi:hypothetical protein ACGFYQ_33995 [Streptomyces sp. NPDC048258]|uniref:hypothetical protein n=1 Tax=Streptomyces sp. NPDC048258 TaxID=3365527 RepID=UPI003717F4FD